MSRGSELEPVGLLDEGTNLIHIGPEKTGSTAIQSAFASLRPRLKNYGVVYPGNPTYPRPYIEALGFRGMSGAKPRDPAEWPALLEEVSKAEDKRVLISHEQLGRSTDDQIRRVIENLGGSRPHVLMVARRYDTYLPSQWQQSVKARVTRSYQDFLHLVMQEESDHPLWRRIWLPHDTADQVRRWASIVGFDAVTVVVANDMDRALLPRTFERMFGLPDGLVGENVRRSNRSLTYPEAELLRQFVLALKDRQATPEEFHRLLRKGALRAMLKEPAASNEAKVPPLPEWAMAAVRTRSKLRLAELRSLEQTGVWIIGDLQRLDVPPDAPVATDIRPPASISVETATRVIARLGEQELRGRRKRAASRPREKTGSAVSPPRRKWLRR